MSQRKKLKQRRFDPIRFAEILSPRDSVGEKPQESACIPIILQQAWEEHKKILPRKTFSIPLAISTRLMAFLMEERENAKHIVYELSLRKIRRLKKREAKHPNVNTEIFTEKEVISEEI